MDYLHAARLAVAEAQERGAAASEAYVLEADALTIEILEQNLETLKLAKDRGIGLKVLDKNGAMGFAYSTEISETEIKGLAGQALANSRSTYANPHNKLPVPSADLELPADLLNPSLAASSVEDKIELVQKTEMAAKRYDRRVLKAERCAYQESAYGVALANSNGIAHYYRAGYCGIYCSVLASETTDIQSGMSLFYGHSLRQIEPETLGAEAARQAVWLLGAKPVQTSRVTVLLSPYVAANFLSVLTSSFSADAVQKGRSMLKSKRGELVASPLINIIDDGMLSCGIASAPCDGEGVPTQRTPLIEKGVLTGFLYNTYTASRANVESTGNGVRSSFKSTAEVGATNIYIEPGAEEPSSLMAQIENGFYITGVMGLHMANPISGDFSLGASGVWIKKGQFTHAVRGVAIAGNILELFSKVEGVGCDLRFFGTQGAPSLRIANVTVSA